MSDSIRISVDAMVGDKGPRVAVEGALLFWRERKNTSFIFHGREAELKPLLDEFPDLRKVSRIVDAEVVISMEEKPSQALRKGRWKSSMWRAIEAVKKGDADVALSAGNTGALMAMSKFCLKSMPQVDRPALAGL